MPRHTKSRLGCRECKHRKVKCDESQPACQRCKKTARSCSYQEQAASLPTPSSEAIDEGWSDRTGRSPGSSLPVPSHQTPPAYGGLYASLQSHSHDLYFTERFSLLHLDLLSHFEAVLPNAVASRELNQGLLLARREAFNAPYLMDQLLAFAAAHRGSTDRNESSRQLYRTEAIRLQTRALGQLNLGTVEVTENNVLALFFFSMLLGQQILFDVFSSSPTVPAVLDRLAQCLVLHRGTRRIVSDSAGKFEQLLRDQIPGDSTYLTGSLEALPTGSECDSLASRLREADITEATRATYLEVVDILRNLFAAVRHDPPRRYIVIQEWLVRVPQDYIKLLQQRRPEALVLLSFYAVLLHQARDYWVVGECGSSLMASISDHLGEYWAAWLEWPLGEITAQSS